MSNSNIHYQTSEIEAFYSHHRIAWDQFYESERIVLSRLNLNEDTKVLDIGCGCGGLGLALRERFGVSDYTGIDINPQAVRAATEMNPSGRFLAVDVLDVSLQVLREESFELVVSLSCIDWNVEFDQMLAKAYQYVKPGGYFLASFRLTDESGVSDFSHSYQFINFNGVLEGEKAPYVVLNGHDLLMRLTALRPSEILGYGYWGLPSSTAVTPFERICFAVIAVRKGASEPCQILVELPEDINFSPMVALFDAQSFAEN